MAEIRVANAPCSWGVLEFEGKSTTDTGYETVLREMAEAGYDGTELGDPGFMPTDPGLLGDALSANGLSMLAAMVPSTFADSTTHASSTNRALALARVLSAVSEHAFIVLADDNGADEMRTLHAGRVRADQGLDEAQLVTFARGVTEAAEMVRDETGLRTVFHHHCAGFVETEPELAALMTRTDPELVGLCLDTGHLRYAGSDPRDVLAKYGGRVWHVHFKDCEPDVAARARAEERDYFWAVQHGVFCELGKGTVDFPGIADDLRDRGYDGWIVVEQDVLPSMGTPAESARRNRAYLRTLGL